MQSTCHCRDYGNSTRTLARSSVLFLPHDIDFTFTDYVLVTAQDPKKPYYDPKDNKPDAPKWSVVHVEFREKFKTPIELTKLRELAAKADGLEGLQMLKQTRLSVSKVEPPEWEYLMRWSKEAENDMD